MLVTAIYFASSLFAYALMLCVMSYNVGVFMTAIVSLTISHFVFNHFKLKRHSASENIEDMAPFMMITAGYDPKEFYQPPKKRVGSKK